LLPCPIATPVKMCIGWWERFGRMRRRGKVDLHIYLHLTIAWRKDCQHSVSVWLVDLSDRRYRLPVWLIGRNDWLTFCLANLLNWFSFCLADTLIDCLPALLIRFLSGWPHWLKDWLAVLLGWVTLLTRFLDDWPHWLIRLLSEWVIWLNRFLSDWLGGCLKDEPSLICRYFNFITKWRGRNNEKKWLMYWLTLQTYEVSRVLAVDCKLKLGESSQRKYEGVSKSFRTGRLERELQMVQLSDTSCSCIAILWVSLVSFAAITLCVASQRVFVVVYFVIDSVRKLLDTPSYITWTPDRLFRLLTPGWNPIHGR
jgi:hypothetical protein